ncbi:hypothetical protein HPB48_019179 [Haemaphysalis longicornis]|uniref:Uncharacterized protein n=1 Tax=Haemaphysalis longicornis TaxID=44386 RepID=A0A9J6FS66_HAELO|nr:hypothetical protein HPB48_019179 [Haemaphysalis longicornis]
MFQDAKVSKGIPEDFTVKLEPSGEERVLHSTIQILSCRGVTIQAIACPHASLRSGVEGSTLLAVLPRKAPITKAAVVLQSVQGRARTGGFKEPIDHPGVELSQACSPTLQLRSALHGGHLQEPTGLEMGILQGSCKPC